MEKKYDVFISYSRKDYLKEDEKTPDPNKIVSKIMKVLDAHKIFYWIDKQGLYSSVQFAAVIEEQISDARCFLFISTQASNASKYTLGEVFTAVEYEKPIIPFRADDSKFGKGIGFHLRPLDHIEYFKTGDGAFAKLVTSINHIKANQLHDQLIGEYNNIMAEYKIKLRAKSDEMKLLGITPPDEYLIDNDVKNIRAIYEQKLTKLKSENDALSTRLNRKESDEQNLKEQLVAQMEKKDSAIESYKQKISEQSEEIKKLKSEINARKQYTETPSFSRKVKRMNEMLIGEAKESILTNITKYKKISKYDIPNIIIPSCNYDRAIFGSDKLKNIGFNPNKCIRTLENDYGIKLSLFDLQCCNTYDDVKRLIANRAGIQI